MEFFALHPPPKHFNSDLPYKYGLFPFFLFFASPLFLHHFFQFHRPNSTSDFYSYQQAMFTDTANAP